MNITHRILPIAGIVTLAAGLTACSSVDPYGPNNYPVSSANATSGYYGNQPSQGVEYGRVTNVALVSNGMGAPGATSNNNSTAGTLIGAVVGGALGNQIGSGSGRAAATILGAVGGAAVGNRIANNNNTNNYNTTGPVYRVWVQTDSGAMRTYDVSSTGDLRPGDRVRIENGVIYMG